MQHVDPSGGALRALRRRSPLFVFWLGLASCALSDEDGDGYDLEIDCDDTDPEVHPDALEVCDDIDNDCDGIADEPQAVGAPAWWADQDDDGYGDPNFVVKACDDPLGFVDNDLDCDDERDDVNPDVPETVGDGLDNDCDETTPD